MTVVESVVPDSVPHPGGLLDAWLDTVERRVERTIADDDHMKSPTEALYLAIGRSALRNVALALMTAGSGNVRAMLDFACGAGRVARWLRAGFPDASLTVADINPSWVKFCAKTFGATPFLSTPELATLALPGRYDLIWVGSLLTHLPEESSSAVLDKLHGALAPQGVLVFTVHGRRMVMNQLSGKHAYLNAALFSAVAVAALAADYGFSSHVPGQPTGISVTSAAWICRWCGQAPDRRLVGIAESGWSNQQDVVAVTNVPY